MAKQYDANDFDQLSFFGNHEPASIHFSNDDVQRIYGKKKPLQKRASYTDARRMTAFANDDSVKQRNEVSSLLKKFRALEGLRSRLSEKQYQLSRNHMQRGILALCRDPSCSASPTAKQLREKIDKAFGGDRDR